MAEIDWTGLEQTAIASAVQAGTNFVLGKATPPAASVPAAPPVNTQQGAAQTQQNLDDPNQAINPYYIYGGVAVLLLVMVVVIAKR